MNAEQKAELRRLAERIIANEQQDTWNWTYDNDPRDYLLAIIPGFILVLLDEIARLRTLIDRTRKDLFELLDDGVSCDDLYTQINCIANSDRWDAQDGER